MQYIKRKSLIKKFNAAITSPIMIVCAPKGFGKRTFVSHYVEDHAYMQVKFHLSQGYDETWQWITFQQKMKAALHCQEDVDTFPIPHTQEELMNILFLYRQYTSEEVYIVLDGIEGSYPNLQQLVMLFSSVNTVGFHLILICDTLHNEFMDRYKAVASIFTIDDFRLTYHEITALLAKEHVTVLKDTVHSILRYTDGWISAIELIVLSLQKENYMNEKKNIHNLIQDTFYMPLPDDVKEDLLYLGLLNEFTLEQLYAIFQSKDSLKYLLRMEEQQLFIHGSPNEGYTISGVFKDFLKLELYKSDVDVFHRYQIIAQWFLQHNDVIRALTMYLECNNFNGIVDVLHIHYERSYMDSAPSLMIEIFKRMPMSYKYENPYIYLSHILDVMTNIDVHHGQKLLEEFKRDLKKKLYIGDENQLLGEYYFIHAFTYYNDASKMLDDFDRASSAFHGGKSYFAYPFMVSTFGSYHVLYLYHHQPGGLSALVNEIDQRLSTLVYISNGVNGGGEYQVKAEMAYECGYYENVTSLGQYAQQETKRYQQVSVEICSVFLRARYAILHHDTILHQEMVQELDRLYQLRNVAVIQSEIECAQTYLYLLEGNTRDVVDWVKNEKILYPQLLYEAGMISFIILCLYQICMCNYEKVVYYCGILEQAYEEQVHVFGLLYTKNCKAIARYHLGYKKEAIQLLHDACTLAQPDHLITIFKEWGSHLAVLLDRFVPENSFEEEVKTAIHSQIRAHKERPVFHLLTRKEKEVMLKYASNMTTKEISQELELSVNTVQTHLKSIYSKLKINSKVELFQIVNREQMK